ncbi:MAG: sulfite exporter TauE/SafE family protein [Candidatus Moranbacteria bacterium]|nr:sulfite exporter TauE/SafE family protein [Candidatus Moranbacteria bacterium]
MEVSFIDLGLANVTILFLVGFVGGLVSGFIGSGGAFVMTPAMMTLGVPGVVAVASNICHKFPKALVGALKRHKYGQVDWKLGIVMGVFAEFGMIAGKHMMIGIRESYGNTGTDLYVSVIFVVTLAIVGGYVLRDAWQLHLAHRKHGELPPHKPTRIAEWIRSVHIPGTMMRFDCTGVPVSVLFLAPLGFATGMLAATIAVGGFIGVPAMIYLLGVPALTATATELVIAFVMGLGGTILYALEGVVDIRLAMIILAGSLFGIQLGAIGTTYVKDHVVKFVMGLIMVIVLVSRFFYIPGYLSKLGLIDPWSDRTISMLKIMGDATLALALIAGATIVLVSLFRGMAEERLRTIGK